MRLARAKNLLPDIFFIVSVNFQRARSAKQRGMEDDGGCIRGCRKRGGAQFIPKSTTKNSNIFAVKKYLFLFKKFVIFYWCCKISVIL